MIRGIDISNNNYQYLALAGFRPLLKPDEFVIMKASEGATYKDNKLDLYYNLVHESGDGRPDRNRLYGFYHFARPDNCNNPRAEAANFLRLIRHHAGHAIFALDVEADALKLSQDHLDSWVAEWCEYVVDHAGVKPMIYCSAAATSRFPTAAKMSCGLWVASWGKKPTKAAIKPWDLWAIWQDSTSSGMLDTNIFNGTPLQFRKYCERL